MADETKPEVPSAPPTGATPAAAPAAAKAAPAAAAAKPAAAPAAAGAHAAKPAAPAAPRPPAAPIPDLAGKTTNAASAGGAAASCSDSTGGGDARRRRHLAAPHAPRLDGPGVGRVLGGVGRRAGGDRPLHVSQRAQRAAAAVQGRLPERVRHGRRRALEGEVRHLARAHARRHRRRAPAASTRSSPRARIWAARRTILSAENKFKCPCHGSGFRTTGINFEGPAPRPLERARIVLADDGQILDRQVPEVPVRARAMDRSGGVSEGVK